MWLEAISVGGSNSMENNKFPQRNTMHLIKVLVPHSQPPPSLTILLRREHKNDVMLHHSAIFLRLCFRLCFSSFSIEKMTWDECLCVFFSVFHSRAFFPIAKLCHIDGIMSAMSFISPPLPTSRNFHEDIMLRILLVDGKRRARGLRKELCDGKNNKIRLYLIILPAWSIASPLPNMW